MPTSRTPGYGLFRGRVACDCLIAWLPVYERKLIEAGAIKKNIDIAQLTGGAAASAGTHSQGGAYDIWQSSWKALEIADEMGAVSWGRTRKQGFAPHQHGILRGCPHNGPARYQITAADAGYNGLGYAGRGGRDDGPKPRSKRTWKQGIEWAEEDMPLSDSDINKIVKALKAELFEADVIPIQEPVGTEESRKANPNWKVSSVLSTLLREVVRTRDMVSEQKNPGSDVVPGKAQS